MQLYGVETWILYIFDIYLCELIKVECVVQKQYSFDGYLGR